MDAYGSNNNVIVGQYSRIVKILSPPPCSCLKELGPYEITTDVGIGKDCSLYVFSGRGTVYMYTKN